ncbi:MAG: M20 family metallo-hydrolase [Lachnospiraceae bacterium]|nr:M20 family metallo-hydrolase [Lachnospiraceae bacterium]
MNLTQLLTAADPYAETCTAIRRDFHKYAELAWTEFRTTAKIIDFLKQHGVPVKFGLDLVNPEYTWSYPDEETLVLHKTRAIEQGADEALVSAMAGYTGAMAVIDSGKPGPTYIFRFDIDCNDVDEAADPGHRPFKEGFSSVNEHCMHACGHDGHAAMGMVLAAVLHENRELLTGKVKVIFQPGEEGDKGAQAIVERGVLDDGDVVMGMHIFGTEGLYPGLCGTIKGLYATTKFDIAFTGDNSHAGAAPEDGKNAILAAAMAIGGMNSFLQDGRGSSRLNIGTINGGTGRNVVAKNCVLRAETRGSDTAVEQRLYKAAVRCVKAAADAFECESDIRIMGSCPTGNGDDALAELIIQASEAVDVLKDRKLVLINTGGTDDFAYMMRRLQERGKPACYMALLTKIAAGHHNSRFDFDECCLIAGVKACLAALVRLMEQASREKSEEETVQ